MDNQILAHTKYNCMYLLVRPESRYLKCTRVLSYPFVISLQLSQTTKKYIEEQEECGRIEG